MAEMRLAVLIDADNATARLAAELLEEVAKYGTPTIKRAYGDRTSPSAAITGTSGDDGWAILSAVGDNLRRNNAAFDPRDYGHTKLGELVRAEPYVEVKEVPGAAGLSQLWVKLKKK